LNCTAKIEERPSSIGRNPVHSVYDPLVDTEDDRVGRVDRLDEAEAVQHCTNGRTFGPVPEPVLGVDLVDGEELHLADG
jgi:hypothetical protein